MCTLLGERTDVYVISCACTVNSSHAYKYYIIMIIIDGRVNVIKRNSYGAAQDNRDVLLYAARCGLEIVYRHTHALVNRRTRAAYGQFLKHSI